MPPIFRTKILVPILATAALVAARAQVQDAPPVNASEILATLRQLRDTQVAQIKTAKQAALQQVTSAAGNGERAAAMWEEAVRATQFEGVAKENAAFRDWWDREGAGLKGKQAQNAARLYFVWLSLTLQRSSGTPVKDLLQQIVNFTKEATQDASIAEALDAAVQVEKERSNGKRPLHGGEASVKKMHDQIMHKALAGSPVVQWLKISDYVALEKWEGTPSNIEGIFTKIILPELRAEKDPRVLEYWDMKLKKEADAASQRHAEFEMTKFNTVRRPQLLFSRAEDEAVIGQRNKAAGDMLVLIKTYPTHADASTWMTKLEELLAPPPPPSASGQ